MNRVGDKMNQQTQSREGPQQAADEGSFSSLDLNLEEQWRKSKVWKLSVSPPEIREEAIRWADSAS